MCDKRSISCFSFTVLMLSASRANAYNAAGAMQEFVILCLIIAVLVFLFIMAAVNYFKPSRDDSTEDAATDDVSTQVLPPDGEDPGDQAISRISYVFRKSFLIFVILVIIGIIIATINMDA